MTKPAEVPQSSRMPSAARAEQPAARWVRRTLVGVAVAGLATALVATVLRPVLATEPAAAAATPRLEAAPVAARPPVRILPQKTGLALPGQDGGSAVAAVRPAQVEAASAPALAGAVRELRASVAQAAQRAAASSRAAGAVVPGSSAPMAAPMATAATSFRIGEFNVLGSWHTRPHRDMTYMGPGPMRARWAAEVVRIYQPGVLGLNEIEPDQVSVMAAQLPQYSFYPGNALGDKGVRNTITWDNRRFTKTAEGYLPLSFLDQVRYNPYVRLRDRATGQEFWVMNVHNTPRRGDDSATSRQRHNQVVAEVAKINDLARTGLPVFLTGDMNEKQDTHCYIVTHSPLRPPQGGGDSCTLPPGSHIEWIFGSKVRWSNFKYDRGPLVARTTDHHIILATATIG